MEPLSRPQSAFILVMAGLFVIGCALYFKCSPGAVDMYTAGSSNAVEAFEFPKPETTASPALEPEVDSALRNTTLYKIRNGSSAGSVPFSLRLMLERSANRGGNSIEFSFDKKSGPGTDDRGPWLDLNRASAQDLDLLPGIGPVRARSIVEYREKHGKFRSVEELDNVNGIGPKTLDEIRDSVYINSPENKQGR